MNATHTPGPWTAHNNDKPATGDDDGLRGWDILPPFDGEAGYRGGVATVYDAEHISGISREERDANARLIAATPDLLAAAQAALAAIEGTLRARNYKIGECTDEWAEEVRTEVATRAKLRAAIALATGAA